MAGQRARYSTLATQPHRSGRRGESVAVGVLSLRQTGGAVADVAADATSYAGPDASFAIVGMGRDDAAVTQPGQVRSDGPVIRRRATLYRTLSTSNGRRRASVRAIVGNTSAPSQISSR